MSMSPGKEACHECGIDMQAGFDLYVGAYSVSFVAQGCPSVVRMKMTFDVLMEIERLMQLVTDNKLTSVRLADFPLDHLVDSDSEECMYWNLVVEDDGFRLEPDEGGVGVRTQMIFMASVLDAIRARTNKEFSSLCERWHADALIVRNIAIDTFIIEVEETFPELRAAAAALAMSSAIDGAMAGSAITSSPARRQPRI